MNESQIDKEQIPTFIKQTSFISSTDPNISTNHTFTTIKKNKKRIPWSEEEDKSIKSLVNKYGTGNWTLISNEMGQNRSGKQCRERWYNQLNPNVKKNNWTDEEENILFTKHMQLGNKWSDIASYLPGRTLNDIKNHFYSKLRKFIRKILKQINDENLFKINGIDSSKYTGEKIYKMIKKHEITYKNLTKDTIFELIIATEKNPKGKFIFFNDNSNNNEYNSYNYNHINNIGNNNNFSNNNINNENENNNDNKNIGNKNDLDKCLQINQEKKEKIFNKKNLNKNIKINEKDKINNDIRIKLKCFNKNNENNNDLKSIINLNYKLQKKSKSYELNKKSKKKKKIKIINNIQNLKKEIKNNQNKDKIFLNQNMNQKLIGQKRKKSKLNNKISKNNNNNIIKLSQKNKNNKFLNNNQNYNNEYEDLILSEDLSKKKKINENIKNKKRKIKEMNKEELNIKNINEDNENNNYKINKKVLNEIKFQSKNENKDNNNFCFYPPFKITTPKTTKNIQFPSSETKSNRSMKPDDFSFNKINLNDYYDSSQMQQIFPIGYENMQKNNKNIFISDLSFENNFLKSRGSCFGSSKNDNTYKNFSICGGGNICNKLMMQGNINNSINNNMTIKSLDENNILDEKNETNINKKIDKPTINLDLINHQDFTNTFVNGNLIGNESQYNFFFNKNNPSNIYNYSPSSVCFPRVFGNEL